MKTETKLQILSAVFAATIVTMTANLAGGAFELMTPEQVRTSVMFIAASGILLFLLGYASERWNDWKWSIAPDAVGIGLLAIIALNAAAAKPGIALLDAPMAMLRLVVAFPAFFVGYAMGKDRFRRLHAVPG